MVEPSETYLKIDMEMHVIGCVVQRNDGLLLYCGAEELNLACEKSMLGLAAANFASISCCWI